MTKSCTTTKEGYDLDTNKDSILNNPELVAVCAAEYLSGLFLVGQYFYASGEEILKHIGYRDKHWLKSLLSALAPLSKVTGCQGVQALATDEVDEILSRETVAIICLADNILTTMYHEFIIHEHCERLSRHPQLTKDDKAFLRRLKTAQAKFKKLEETFLKVAFVGDPPKLFKSEFAVDRIDLMPEMHIALIAAPVVYRNCPRYLTTDYSMITKLRQKYRNEIILCESWRNEHHQTSVNAQDFGDVFNIQTNGKF